MKLLIVSSLMLAVFSLVGCANKVKNSTLKNEILPFSPKEQPNVDVKITMQSMETLAKLKGSVAVVLVFNHPDAYLVKAKDKIFPPGLALEEVASLQEERNEWMDQAIVSACDDCQKFETLSPLDNYSEERFLKLTDRAAKNLDVTFEEIKLSPELMKQYKYIWVITGRADTDQKRGPTEDTHVIAASSFRTVDLKSIIYDTTSKDVVSSASVLGQDQESILYNRQTDGVFKKAGQLIPKIFKSKITHGEGFADQKYDEIYPYPPEPEAYYIIQKSLYKIVEELNP